VDIGLKILAAFRIGLVLTDAPQTAEAGDDAAPVWAELDRLALAARKTPLVLYAGAHPERYAEYTAHGIAACLAKPLDLDAVVALVGTLLPPDGHQLAVAHGSATAIKG